jgi:methylphosphotriester-DNA--protein-cysteine methyltransferase
MVLAPALREGKQAMVNTPLHCEQVWPEISNYVDGEVEASLRAAMDEHFRTCKRCTAVLEGTRNVVRLYSDERMMEVPAGFGRRLQESLEKRRAQDARASRARWSSWTAWLVPVAAIALITAGVWMANSWTVQHQERSQMAAIERNIPPDMQVVVLEGAKIFHVASCGLIRDKDKDKLRTLTAKDAIQQGYTPCLRCLRKYVDTTAGAGHATSGSEADLRDVDADDEKHDGGQ